jgi:hypothetical protein
MAAARIAPAQHSIGDPIECRDHRQVLLGAGYINGDNDAKRPGVTGRVMVALRCDTGGRDGVEAVYFHVPYVESRYPRDGSSFQVTATGSGSDAQYLGIVTERALPSLVENLHFVLGVGAYNGRTREVWESTSATSQGDVVDRYDMGSPRRGGVGASIGLAFLVAAPMATVNFEVRQHVSGVGSFLAFSFGILF